MARIAGIDLPREKRVEIGLTYIYGIGRSMSNEILGQAGVNPDTRVRDLAEDEIARLREVISRGYRVEGDLRREVSGNIKRLIEIGAIVDCGIGAGFPFTGREPARTHVRARDPKRPWRAVVAAAGQRKSRVERIAIVRRQNGTKEKPSGLPWGIAACAQECADGTGARSRHVQ
jgi:small subunit ribosomal protein S13